MKSRSAPDWDGGLSGSDSGGTGWIIGASHTSAVLRQLQTHEAELHLTVRTHQVLALEGVMFHQGSAGGTGADGGAAHHSLHLAELDHLAGLQSDQRWVQAARVIAVVWAISRTLPPQQTLPAEVKGGSVTRRALGAAHTQVVRILPQNIRPTARTRFGPQIIDGVVFEQNALEGGLLFVRQKSHFRDFVETPLGLTDAALQFASTFVQLPLTPASERSRSDCVTAGHTSSSGGVTITFKVVIIVTVHKSEGRVMRVVAFFRRSHRLQIFKISDPIS